MRRIGSRLYVVQDDVNALAVFDEDDVRTRALLLPVGPGGRRVFDDEIGNKDAKLDLEACAALPDGRLVAFGSGSSPMREKLAVLSSDRAEVRLVDAASLYAELRGCAQFAGSELNIEGAVVSGDDLWLFQRGNGAVRGGLEPVNAIGRVRVDAFVAFLDRGAAVVRLESVTRVELGAIAGARLGFTDAAILDDGRVAVLACAEASPDAVRDGPVVGCRFGLLDDGELRMTDVVDTRGEILVLKLEGLEPRREGGRATGELEFDVVADVDRASEPALLGRLRVRDGASPLDASVPE